MAIQHVLLDETQAALNKFHANGSQDDIGTKGMTDCEIQDDAQDCTKHEKNVQDVS
jgi:hypothetical protein